MKYWRFRAEDYRPVADYLPSVLAFNPVYHNNKLNAVSLFFKPKTVDVFRKYF